MSDVFKPENQMNYTMHDFRKNKEMASAFINSLVNLNKFISFEQRDPFQFKNEINETPGFNEWDRFARFE